MIDQQLASYHDAHTRYLEKIMKEKPQVSVYYNNEAGEWWWSVEVVGTEYWIDSFDSEKEAKEFCLEKGLKIVKEKQSS